MFSPEKLQTESSFRLQPKPEELRNFFKLKYLKLSLGKEIKEGG